MTQIFSENFDKGSMYAIALVDFGGIGYWLVGRREKCGAVAGGLLIESAGFTGHWGTIAELSLP
jgi:hypothetical protein